MTKPKILIVEDESLIALEIETRLKKYGYEICGKATNSEETLKIVQTETPDLVLMDIMIKGKLDGIQTTKEINKLSNIPVVYLTAYVDQKTIDRAKETNPFGYLSKPIQERDLRSTIEMAIHKSQMETELKVTKNWLEITLASIGDAVIATDAEGKIKFLNEVAEQLTGWKHIDAMGLELSEVFSIEDEYTGDKVENPVDIVLKTGEIVTLSNHTNLISKNGERRSILDSAAPIKDEKNIIQGVVLVFHDNTERKKAQIELQKESNFRRLIIDFAAEGIFAFTGLENFPKLKFTLWNDRMVEITGYTIDEINKGGIDSVKCYPEISSAFSAMIENLIMNGRILSSEFEFRDRNGSQKILSVSASVIKQEFENDLVAGLITDLTERKKDEIKIKESEQNFRTLAENTPVGVFIHRGEDLIYLNKVASDQLDYTYDELIKMKFWEMAHPDYREQIKDIAFSKVSKEDGAKRYEVKLVTKSGEEKWAEISATNTIFNGIPALLSIAIDTTERKRVEEKLLLFAHAIRNISDCVTITDLNNNLLYVNEAFERTYGYKAEEVLGKHISIVTYYSEDTVESIRQETLKDGWQGELINRKKDGTIFPISLTTSTIYDDNNKPVGLVGVTTDITERKLAEEKIRQSEKEYRGLFESAHDAIVIFKPDNETVLDVNQKACEMYGLTKEQFIGMSMIKLSKYPDEGKVHVNNTLREGIRYQFETTQFKADGSEIDLEISASVIEYKKQQAILSINRDITDRKLQERALRQSEERYRNLFETMNQGVVYQTPEGKILSVNPAAEQLLGISFDQLKGRSATDPNWKSLREDGSLFPGEEHPTVRAAKTGKAVKGEIMGVFNPTLNDYKWILVDAVPEFLPGSDKPYRVFATFSDITQLRRAEKIQQSFYKISEASNSSANLEILFANIHSIVRELIRAENFYIALYDKNTKTLSFPYFVDERDPHPVPRKLGGGLTDYVIREKETLSLSKEKFESMKKKLGMELIGSISNHWLGVPLKVDDEVIGVMVVQEYSQGIAYTEEEEKILITISNQVALAIQRKKYSDALTESEEKYRTIFNTAPVGIFQSDLDGRLITVNKSFVDMLGFGSPEEMMLLSMEKLYYNHGDRKKLLKQLLNKGSVVDAEVEWKKRDGTKIWVELTAYLFKAEDGSVEHFEGFVKDVTQRKLDQELILQLSSGIEQSPTSVVITDTEGNIEYVNPKFSELTGYSFEEVKGKKPSVLKSNETDPELYKNLWETITSGKQWRGEFLNKKKNGELYWELAFIFPLYDYAGKISQYLGIKIDITDRKMLEHELKRYQEDLEELIEQRTDELRLSEQKFKALAENSDDLITRFNNSLEILYVNPAVYKVTGKSAESLIGKSIDQFGFPKQLKKLWEKSLMKVIQFKERDRIEFMLPNGIWLDWLLIPEFDKNDEVRSVFTSGRDITNMKKVENELHRRDKLLQGVASASNILFTLEDFDKRIFDSVEVIGKAAEVECVYIFESIFDVENGKNFLELRHHWSDVKKLEVHKKMLKELSRSKNFITEKMLEQLQNGLPVTGVRDDFPKSIKKMMESEGIVSLLNVPIEVFGNFWGFIGFNECEKERLWSESEIAILSTLASDIGGAIARKIVEDQLRSSEERLKILFDYAPEAYFMIDHNGYFIDGNKEAELTFGYSKEELLSKKQLQSEIFPEEYSSVIQSILTDGRMNLPTGPDELEIIRKDGSRANIELNTYPVNIEGKKLILGAAHDISYRKKAEEEIKNALKHSQDLNQIKSRFVSMVSHEFRTPLSTILSSLELLEIYEERLSKEEKSSHFGKITKSVDYLTELLDDVITINRADSGRLEAKYGDYELIELVKQLISELRGSYGEVPNIIYHSTLEILVARIDEKLFRQIISNLVSNAIKYTPPDKNIFINLTEKDGEFIFEIKDEGVGIPSDSQKELFTPFYRASNIGTVPGTGLGLAITKRSVELLNGKINFNSEENIGTVFQVKLPISGDKQ